MNLSQNGLDFQKQSVKDELSEFNIDIDEKIILKIKIILINLFKGYVMSDELKIPSSQVLVNTKKLQNQSFSR